MGPVIELTTIYVQWQLYNTDISKEWGYTANVCKVLSWRIKLNQNDEQSQKSKASMMWKKVFLPVNTTELTELTTELTQLNH